MKYCMILLIGLSLSQFGYAQENNRSAGDEGWTYSELVDSLQTTPIKEGIVEPQLSETYTEPAIEEFFFEEGDSQENVYPTLHIGQDEAIEEPANHSANFDEYAWKGALADSAENNIEIGQNPGVHAEPNVEGAAEEMADRGGNSSPETKRKQKIIDGAYDRSARLEERIALPHAHIRDADVHFSKRLWREIDCRQKINQHFVYQKKPFVEILLELLEANDGQSVAFADDEFTEPISFDDINQRLNTVQEVEILDPDTYEYKTITVTNEIDFASFSTFRIKEDWFFDTRESKMKPRIIAIAPVRDIYDENDNYRGQEVLFWMHFESVRNQLAKFEAFNPYNDAFQMSWADILDMRYFHSLITKENNFADMRIKEYADGRDAINEHYRIEKKLHNWEQDLWEY